MKKKMLCLLLSLAIASTFGVSVYADDLHTDDALADGPLFSVASYEVASGEVSLQEEYEAAESAGISDAPSYSPGAVPKAAVEIDEETKAALADMGLLTDDGEFDFEAFADLPTLDEFEDGLIPKTVIGSDNRTVVNNNTATPWRWNCYLTAKFPNGKTYRGTAFTMGPRIVGTCGHNLYGSGKGGWAKSVVIVAAKNGSSQPYGTASGRTLHVGGNWQGSEAQNDDWGMVELSSNLGNTVGYYGMSVRGNSQVGKNATITGYPKEVQNNTNSTQMWTHTSGITALVNNMYRYKIDTTGGNSGSAIRDGDRVIGIHAYGNSSFNSGRILDQWLFDFFMKYR